MGVKCLAMTITSREERAKYELRTSLKDMISHLLDIGLTKSKTKVPDFLCCNPLGGVSCEHGRNSFIPELET